MSEQSRDNEALPVAAEQDVLTLIRKMQQQLSFLEKKIDILISQSQAKPSGDKPFSRPFRIEERSFDRERPYEKRHGPEFRGVGYKKQGYGNPREGDFNQGHRFDKRHGPEGRGFQRRTRGYENSGEGDFGRGRQFEKRPGSETGGFEKRHGGEKRVFDQKNKPFSYRRKERR